MGGIKAMLVKRGFFLALGVAVALAGEAAGQTGSSRAGYSYVREVSGEVTVESHWNGTLQASRNMPISVGDMVEVSGGGRAEVGLADGNVLFLGPGSQTRFASIRDQQGEEDSFSMVALEDGSLVLAAVGSDDRALPRIDTDDATIYLASGSLARINYDSKRGTVVVTRAGSADVRTRAGSFKVRSGEYLIVQGDEEPEIQRGAFSRDRFDLWANERYQAGFEVQSTSAQYVDPGYSNEVVALDGYGDWDYSDTSGGYVWRPRVDAGWTPYSYGSWYYTPVGMTWWSYDPWGWYPFHYGNWFFDAAWSSWCWSPAYVYSPAWVYWGYSSGYVGWCPVGYYGYYSPWCNNYYKNWGWTGRGVYLSMHGNYPTRSVDLRGWNFTGSPGFGTAAARMDVIPGARMAGRLGGTVAVSSRPMVVTARPGEVPQAVQGFVREAPRMIERTAGADSARMAPVLARERTLPASTVEALRGRAVVAERGRLIGPGATDIAPRGTRVDSTRTLDFSGRSPATRDSSGFDRSRAGGAQPSVPSSTAKEGTLGRSAPNRIDPRTVVRGDENGVEARTRDTAREDWRAAPRSRDSRPADARDPANDRATHTIDRVPGAPPASREREAPAAQSDWRGRPSTGSQESRPQMMQRSTEDWRTRSTVPPARRVIEGSVPGRSVPDSGGDAFRRSAPRSYSSPQPREYRPDRSGPYSSSPRSAPPPRIESRPQGPSSAPQSQPRSAPAPAPRAPAPPPHSSGSAPRPHG
jgi:hypothetical protein